MFKYFFYLLEVLREQINAYRTVFADAADNVQKLDEALSKYFGAPTNVPEGKFFYFFLKYNSTSLKVFI